jgi:hypothetical protein
MTAAEKKWAIAFRQPGRPSETVAGTSLVQDDGFLTIENGDEIEFMVPEAEVLSIRRIHD